MANSNNTNHTTEFPPITSPSSTPPPSVPLNLSGFLNGDTVQLQGETGELQFSVQFNVRKKENNSVDSFNFKDANVPEVETFRDRMQTPPSSPYATTNFTHVDQDRNEDGNGSFSRGEIVTRLRSGVLSPVKYYCRDVNYSVSLGCTRKKKTSKGRRKGDNALEKMLRRRSFPLRPCSSYAFFLMGNWGVVKRCSFGETSKRLSKQWYKLPHDKKKEYEDMASKDNARYKRQCVLLRDDVEKETRLPADSN